MSSVQFEDLTDSGIRIAFLAVGLSSLACNTPM